MTDQTHMRHALSLGRRGQGNTWPNPSVGCVIVRNGRVVGRGWTQPGGRPHAETQALAQAGEAAKGADVFVTLEPCAHHGQTPPCADALIAAQVSRVVIASGDTDARVAGKGAQMLRDAGIAVQTGLCAADAQHDLFGYFLRTEAGRPMITLKLASSFDGRIATATGESKWITGPHARRAVHALRANHDAVMVGGGTARADDPSLTVRDIGISRQPVRIVVSRLLDLPLMSTLARTAAKIPLILCHGHDADANLREAWTGLGAQLLPCATKGVHLHMADVLQQLGTHGLTRVLCEGGSSLAGSLIAADLADRLIGFTAGAVIGAEGLPNVGGMGVERLAEAPRYRLVRSQPVGADLMHEWALPTP